MKGNVFDIQRYSIHDGSGIRTVVFLKGCPLRCKWCSNPESWAAHPELFYIKSRCVGCLTCTAACSCGEVTPAPAGAADDAPIEIHRDRVTDDLSWTAACPTGALRVKGECMEAQEVFAEILKDRVFYEYSGGGVTLSGGEPLLQADFAAEVLSLCKEAGIQTAVETTGAVPWESLEKVLPFTDLFLYDMKSADPQVHKEWTGVSNERILENFAKLAAAGAEIFVRTPMIPGVNDRKEDIQAIMDILAANGVKRYNILPFHQYGSGKYESIGIPYGLADLQPPAESHVREIKEMMRAAGFSDEM